MSLVVLLDESRIYRSKLSGMLETLRSSYSREEDKDVIHAAMNELFDAALENRELNETCFLSLPKEECRLGGAVVKVYRPKDGGGFQEAYVIENDYRQLISSINVFFVTHNRPRNLDEFLLEYKMDCSSVEKWLEVRQKNKDRITMLEEKLILSKIEG